MTLNFNLPSSWKELSEEQLLFVAGLISSGRTKEEVEVLCFVKFAKVKVLETGGEISVIRCGRKRYLVETLVLDECRRRLSFLTERVEEITPPLHLKGVRCVDHRLRGCPLRHYLAAENYYQAFLYTRQSKYLQLLSCCLYRKETVFDDNNSAALSKRFRFASQGELFISFLWFSGLKGVLSRTFKNYFGPCDTRSEDAVPDIRKMVHATIRSLTGGDVTKTEMVLDTELWTAFEELNAKAKEIKELNAKIKK